jgi:hypothetical protein
MPLDGAAGYSDSTPEKQDNVREVLRTILRIASGARWADALVMDLTSGPGWYDNGVPGSPLLVSELGAHLLCCEKDPSCITKLRERRFSVLEGDHCETVPAWLSRLNGGPQYLGLAYWDPTGAERMPLALFERLAGHRLTKRLDLLCNVNTSARKRVRGYRRSHPEWPGDASLLADEVAAIPKRKVLVRAPFGKQGWTMLFATNYERLSFKAAGFVDAMSFEGQEIIWRADTIAKQEGA